MSIIDRLDQVQCLNGRLTEIAPIPTSVKLETTTLCNHDCSYCSRQYRDRKHGIMSWSFYLNILDQMKEAGVKQVGLFFLGEAFMIKNLHEWVAESKKRGFFTFLTTNGTAPTPKSLKAVMAAGLDSLKFSCNYFDADQFVRIARVNPKLFGRIATNMQTAKKIRDDNGYKCELSASSIMYADYQKDAMEEYMKAVSQWVDVTYWNPFYSMSLYADDLKNATGFTPNVGNPGRLKLVNGKWVPSREPLPCWSAWEGHLGMGDWDEELQDYRYHLSLCCFDGSGRFNMGDLNGPKGMSFVEAWNSEKFVAMRKAHIAKQIAGTVCETCVAYQ